MSLPTTEEVFSLLEDAIVNNKRPADLIHRYLTSGKPQSNIVGNKLLENKVVLKLLTSPHGRQWIQLWLEDTLNFLQMIAESP